MNSIQGRALLDELNELYWINGIKMTYWLIHKTKGTVIADSAQNLSYFVPITLTARANASQSPRNRNRYCNRFDYMSDRSEQQKSPSSSSSRFQVLPPPAPRFVMPPQSGVNPTSNGANLFRPGRHTSQDPLESGGRRRPGPSVMLLSSLGRVPAAVVPLPLP